VGYTAAPTVTLLGGGGGSVTIGTPVIGLDASGGLTKVGTGTLILSGANTYQGTTNITAGLLDITSNSAVNNIGPITGSGTGNLLVDTGAQLQSKGVTLANTTPASWTINGAQRIAAGAGAAGVSKVNVIPTIAHTGSGTSAVYTGVLNLADSALIVETTSSSKSSTISALNEAVFAGSAGATWTGNGITSSTAAADSAHLGMGVWDNSVLGRTSFAGTAVDSTSVFTAVAHLGDANRDGVVDLQDLSIITNNWQKARDNWATGDLNRDGVVDLGDLSLVTNNWQQTSSFNQTVSTLLPASGTSFGSAVAAVPEPTSLALLALGSAALLARRRRK